MGGEGKAARTVLVVDDDEGVRGVLGDMLRDGGYDTIECADLASAQQALEERPRLGLALVDFSLPDGVGVDLCQQLRAAGVPCLIVSAYPTWLVGRPHAQPDWISKPFDVDDVMRRVREATESARS